VDITEREERINTTGWERNLVGKLHPRVVDMSDSMNSEKLAESAVSLNLKLMKWRIAPDVNLDVIRNQKCLLLGSGTLGCNVARGLLAWGVENITFVDNSKVSYSNPVRQSLFVFQDSVGAYAKESFKSVRAAESLKLIYPGVVS
jgi:ubiquitin-like modifier-activating enzyme ATG7